MVPMAGDSAELAGGDGADGVAGAGGEQIDADLGQSGAIDFGKFDFEQNFVGADGAEGENVDDVLRVSGGQGAGMFGDVFGGDVAGENDGGTRRASH